MSMQQTFQEQTRPAEPRRQNWQGDYQEDYGQNRPDSWLPDLPMAADPGQLANGLGWLSIALGLAQLVAPRQVAQLIGVDEHTSETVLRAVGLREIASGIGILSQPESRTRQLGRGACGRRRHGPRLARQGVYSRAKTTRPR